MRLDKFLVSTGKLTRSESGRAARSGRLTVNGVSVRRADMHIDPELDRITLDGEVIVYRRHTYIMLNKPSGYVSATDDKSLPTVLELLPEELRKTGLFPAGRLDRDTVGLMLLTDNGELAHFLLSPVSHVPKSYGFACRDAILTGAETRTSAPLRILRDNDTRLALGYENLYPAGEGAGYAGGITSAAIDGIRTSLAIMKKYKAFKRG